jgi:NADH-quinone oxidoreductase subunit C
VPEGKRESMAMNTLERAAAALQAAWGPRITAVEAFRGQTSLHLEPDVLIPACTLLRDDPALAFNRLSALTAVDHWPKEPRFVMIYQLHSIANRAYLGLRVPLASQSAEIASLVPVYPAANWPEREVYDLFGIRFSGHPDLRRILLPYDWQGHPLRKDYPLGYEEVQFSFNHDEIDRRKPYAAE